HYHHQGARCRENRRAGETSWRAGGPYRDCWRRPARDQKHVRPILRRGQRGPRLRVERDCLRDGITRPPARVSVSGSSDSEVASRIPTQESLSPPLLCGSMALSSKLNVGGAADRWIPPGGNGIDAVAQSRESGPATSRSQL